MRPNPIWAQMMVVLGWRASSAFIWVRKTGCVPALAKGMSMSLWISTTRPVSPA